MGFYFMNPRTENLRARFVFLPNSSLMAAGFCFSCFVCAVVARALHALAVCSSWCWRACISPIMFEGKSLTQHDTQLQGGAHEAQEYAAIREALWTNSMFSACPHLISLHFPGDWSGTHGRHYDVGSAVRRG
jgi:hypothetical protein